MAPDVRRHDCPGGPTVLTVIDPVIGVNHTEVGAIRERIVRNAVVKHKIELAVEPVRTDVFRNRVIVFRIA